MGVKTFASNYSKWTLSFMGVRNLRKQPTCLFRILWSLMLVSMIAAFIAHTVFIIWGYLQYPSSSSLKYVSSSSMPFPAVTVCSINPFKQDQIESNPRLAHFMRGYNYILGEKQKRLGANTSNSSQTNQPRKKRAICSVSGVRMRNNQYDRTYFYTERYCNNVTNVTLQCPGGSPKMDVTYQYLFQPQHQNITEAVFVYCLSAYTCRGVNACTTFTSTMDILNSITSCLTTQGLIGPLGYPPTNNPAVEMAAEIGRSCPSFSDMCQAPIYLIFKTINIFTSTSTILTTEVPTSTSTLLTTSLELSTSKADTTSTDSSSAISSTSTTVPTTELTTSTEILSSTSSTISSTLLSSSQSSSTPSTLVSTEISSTPLESTSTEFPTSISTILSSSFPTVLSSSQSSLTPSTEFPTSILTTSELSIEISTPFESTSIEISTSTELPTSTSTSTIFDSTTIFSSTSSIQPDETTASSSTIQSSTSEDSWTSVLSTSSSKITTVPSSTLRPESSTIESSTLSSTKIDSTTGIMTSQSVTQTSPIMQSSLHTSTSTSVSESPRTFQSSSTKILPTSYESTVETTRKSSPVQTLSTVQSSISSGPNQTTGKSSPTQTLSTVQSSGSHQTTGKSSSFTPTSPNIQTSLYTSKSSSFTPTSPNIQTSLYTSKSNSFTPTSPNIQTSLYTSKSTQQSTKSSNIQTSLYTSKSTQQSTKSSSDTKTSLSTAVLSSATSKSTPVSSFSTGQSYVSTASNQTTVKSSTASLNQTTIKSTPVSLFSTNSLFSSSTAFKATPVSSFSTMQSSPSSSNQTTIKLSTTQTLPISDTSILILGAKSSTRPIVSTLMPSTKILYPDNTKKSSLSSLKVSNSITSSTFKSLSPPNISTEKMTGQEVAKLWGLNEDQSQPSFVARVRESLIEIAATLSPEERQQLFYSLPELVSSCKLGNTPCDMENDFVQMFDVDYGYCYTYNPKMPIGVHNITRSGRKHGLRMVLFTNPITQMNTTESVGFKIAVHPQELAPFPNTQGYFGEVGRSIDFVLSEKRYIRLNKPYGNCDTSETLKARGQPFFFNGSYTMEGCFRSCFQEKMVNACGCADPRFPHAGKVKLCTHENVENHKCNQNYIKNNGDYYFVNCTCYNPCSETEFKTELLSGKWPSGEFFSEQYCPAAQLANQDCKKYYFDNSAEIFVYYDRLSHSILERSPSNRVVDLISGIGNSSYTWIGCSLFTLAEILLVLIQSLLWCFCCRFELPEVPSCRRSQNSIRNKEEECTDPNEFTGDSRPSLNCENALNESSADLVLDSGEKDDLPEFQLMYRHLVSKKDPENLPPVPVSCTVTEMPPFVGNMK